ncbi:unnamed protein product [Phytomonas sp. Hart1]|nr:unnamed protein product [Phytomonas sp. Hart1]|eukprot:CCW70750.1 unnamed protein product [Phytomonas sp. isolate Hart1]
MRDVKGVVRAGQHLRHVQREGAAVGPHRVLGKPHDVQLVRGDGGGEGGVNTAGRQAIAEFGKNANVEGLGRLPVDAQGVRAVPALPFHQPVLLPDLHQADLQGRDGLDELRPRGVAPGAGDRLAVLAQHLLSDPHGVARPGGEVAEPLRGLRRFVDPRAVHQRLLALVEGPLRPQRANRDLIIVNRGGGREAHQPRRLRVVARALPAEADEVLPDRLHLRLEQRKGAHRQRRAPMAPLLLVLPPPHRD